MGDTKEINEKVRGKAKRDNLGLRGSSVDIHIVEGQVQGGRKVWWNLRK